MSYVGITGVTSKEQAEILASIVAKKPIEVDHQLMMGVLVSEKSMRGQTTHFPKRYPKVDDVSQIFSGSPNTFNVIHFHTKNQSQLNEQLRCLVAEAGPFLRGFQLNMTWPALAELSKFRENWPDLKIILQVGSRSFASMNRDPKQIAAKVAQYKDLADYVLLDDSGGYQRLIDQNFIIACLRALEAKKTGLKMAVAGGISALTARTLLDPLLIRFQDISFDAEGGMRNKLDQLDLSQCRIYFDQACRAIIWSQSH